MEKRNEHNIEEQKLKELAPTLSAIPKKNVSNDPPASYFEKMQREVMQKIKPEISSSNKKSVFYLQRYGKIALAAGLALTLSIAIYLFSGQNPDIESPIGQSDDVIISEELYAEYLEEEEIIEVISNAELKNHSFFTENDEDAIVEYLIDEDINEALIVEQF